MATRELYLAAIPTYAMLCDIFIVVAPSPMDDDLDSRMSAHFRGGFSCERSWWVFGCALQVTNTHSLLNSLRSTVRWLVVFFFWIIQGWCKAEFLARLVESGVHNLFFCDSCDGFLQQVTLEMLQTIDLNVFSGEFGCCSVQHVGYELCDREKLRTPILGVYAHYLRKLMSTDEATVSVVQMEQEKERLLPKFFDFVQGVDVLTRTTHTRELFGPLPEILEKRIKASWTKHNAQTLQPSTAPTSDPGRSQRDMVWEEEAGVASTESPEREPSRHEHGQGSSMTAHISSTRVSQMYESEDWVVVDLDAVMKEWTGSSTSSETAVESEWL